MSKNLFTEKDKEDFTKMKRKFSKKGKLRFVLGLFFLLVAVFGAIGMVGDLLDLDIFPEANDHFGESWSREGGASSSNSPFYYSVCLIGGIWLLFGRRDN